MLLTVSSFLIVTAITPMLWVNGTLEQNPYRKITALKGITLMAMGILAVACIKI